MMSDTEKLVHNRRKTGQQLAAANLFLHAVYYTASRLCLVFTITGAGDADALRVILKALMRCYLPYENIVQKQMDHADGFFLQYL